MLVPPVYRRWVTCPEPRPEAKLRLFCFHYAGGDASVYRLWARQLPAWVEVCPLELPGHGSRRGEPPITQFPELLGWLYRMVRPFLDRPYALFGHSLGGIQAFELARRLRREGQALPARLFLSACPALHLRPRPMAPLSHLGDEEFLEQLAVLYGTPRQALVNPDFREAVLPVLRADVLLAESYAYTPEPPLPVPVSSFGAEEDPQVSLEEATSWKEQTLVEFRFRQVPGGHFFLSSERTRLQQAVVEDLRPVV